MALSPRQGWRWRQSTYDLCPRNGRFQQFPIQRSKLPYHLPLRMAFCNFASHGAHGKTCTLFHGGKMSGQSLNIQGVAGEAERFVR